MDGWKMKFPSGTAYVHERVVSFREDTYWGLQMTNKAWIVYDHFVEWVENNKPWYELFLVEGLYPRLNFDSLPGCELVGKINAHGRSGNNSGRWVGWEAQAHCGMSWQQFIYVYDIINDMLCHAVRSPCKICVWFVEFNSTLFSFGVLSGYMMPPCPRFRW